MAGVDDGPECTYGDFDCPLRFSCWPEADGSGGTCRCDAFYGFWGASCEKRSFSTWMVLLCLVLTILSGLWALAANLRLGLRLHKHGALQMDSVGRTLLLNTLYVFPVIVIQCGMMCGTLERYSAERFYSSKIREPLIVFMQFFFVSAELSVFVVWMKMVDDVFAVHSETSILRPRTTNQYILVVYGISMLLFVITMVGFVVLHSYTMMTAVGLFYMLIIGVVSFFASRRVTSVLESPLKVKLVPTAALETYGRAATPIIRHIRHTSRTISALSIVLLCSTVAYGLSRPSPEPIYRQQNRYNGHGLDQGQVPFFLAVNLVNYTSHFISRYLLTWEKRREARAAQSKELIAGRACNTNRSPLAMHGGEVELGNRNVALSVIPETGSEHQSEGQSESQSEGRLR